MKCPICSIDLVMSDKQGVEIDYCPKCRGIWLDRGELEKIIDRSAGLTPPPPISNIPQAPQQQYQPQQPHQPQQPYPSQQQYGHNQHYDKHYDKHHSDHDYYKKKRKENFLFDLFDFD